MKEIPRTPLELSKEINKKDNKGVVRKLVCEANISHAKRIYHREVIYRKSRKGFISPRDRPLDVTQP